MLRRHHLLPVLSQVTGRALQPAHFSAVGGGSINEVYRVDAGNGLPLIVKVNSATIFPQLFALEAKGMDQLRSYFRVPEVIAFGEAGDSQYLVLEWIAQEAHSPAFWKKFGAALAALHTVNGTHFGAAENNYMGAVPQINTPGDDWALFFAQQRLLPLASRCAAQGLLGKKDIAGIDAICSMLPRFFSPTAPVLLHGDLWSGNFICGKGTQPVLIDPAVYFGHPAVDLGMTTLFGGFPPLFYEAYHYHAPLPKNHKEAWDLCNLYPLLIHLLLFGSGYLSRIQRIVQQFTGSNGQMALTAQPRN